MEATDGRDCTREGRSLITKKAGEVTGHKKQLPRGRTSFLHGVHMAQD